MWIGKLQVRREEVQHLLRCTCELHARFGVQGREQELAHELISLKFIKHDIMASWWAADVHKEHKHAEVLVKYLY